MALCIGTVQAQNIIRDAEVEAVIGNILNPLLETTGKSSQTVSFHIVADSSVNAFVQDGQKIFIHTGLILRLETPEQLAGVLAHELGHITGGHLLRSRDAASEALLSSILAGAAAGGAALLGGSGGGSAIAGGLMASGQAGAGSFTAFTRTQESSADQAGLNFLQKAGISGGGMVEVLEMLSKDERGASDYMRSHPLSRDRIAFLKNRLEQNIFVHKNSKTVYNLTDFKRMRAKLAGFLEPSQRVMEYYASEPDSAIKTLAFASALHKEGKGREAFELINQTLEKLPKDAYLHDLAGQIALETGLNDASIAHYRQAYTLSDHNPLIGLTLGQAMIASEKIDILPEAIEIIKKALTKEVYYARGYRDLSIAYDRLEKPFLAATFSAQYYVLIGNNMSATTQAKRALSGLSIGTPEYLRAKDILFFARQNNKDRLEE